MSCHHSLGHQIQRGSKRDLETKRWTEKVKDAEDIAPNIREIRSWSTGELTDSVSTSMEGSQRALMLLSGYVEYIKNAILQPVLQSKPTTLTIVVPPKVLMLIINRMAD